MRPPPERVRAGREGHEDRERTCKGATLHWGGRRLRLRCSGGGGGAARGEPAGGGEGARLPRGERGEEPPGSRGGGLSRGCGRGRWGRGPA